MIDEKILKKLCEYENENKAAEEVARNFRLTKKDVKELWKKVK